MLMIIGATTLWLAQTVTHLYLGRLFIGFGMGVAAMSCQVFLSENSPPHLRGSIVPTFVFSIFIGFISAHLVALEVGRNVNLILGLGVVPALFQFLLVLLTQDETPSFLDQQGYHSKAQEVTKKFYILDNLATQEAMRLHLREIESPVH
jgi:SP family myo-inositol transporter-like MFS transporter 13